MDISSTVGTYTLSFPFTSFSLFIWQIWTSVTDIKVNFYNPQQYNQADYIQATLKWCNIFSKIRYRKGNMLLADSYAHVLF